MGRVMELGEYVLAAGALGTAAFGVVEALKFTGLGNAGFTLAMRELGTLAEAVQVAYGKEYVSLLRGQYRSDDRELMARSLRQGVRVGTTPSNCASTASFLGSINPTALSTALQKAFDGADLSPAERNEIGRFELAADARIESALTLARARYVDSARVTASLVAIGLALAVGVNMDAGWGPSFVVGLAAVPLAPIAKDVASGIQAATRALRAK